MVPVSVVTLIVAVLHPIWSYLLVMYLGFGFIGAAYAVSLSKGLEFLLLVGYLQCSGVLADNNFRWSAKCLDINGWIPYLQYGLPNLLMMSEWWASEVVIFMSGRLPSPEREVAATSIYQSLNSVCFMLPCGFQVSGATRVGNCLGANDASGAQISSRVAPVLALAISVVSSIAVLSLRTELGRAFTDDSEVLVILRSLILVLAGYVLADGVQSALTGVLKGMGRQSDAAPVVVVAYYAVGLPLSAYLGFSFGFGLGSVGLCLGTMAGTVLQMAAYSLICLRTDWSAEAEAAQIKLLQRRAVDEAEDDWWTLDYKAPPPRPRKPLVQSFQSFMSRLLGFEDEVRYELVSLGETGRPVAGRVQSMFDDDGDDRI
jgi:MATE family multidrug resistance protein